MRFALSLSPTIGPPSSLSPLAHPTSVPCRRKFTHLIRVPHQNRTAPLSPSLTPAALEASVVTILSTSVASLLPLFFFFVFFTTFSETMETPTRWRSFCLLPRRRGRSSTPSMWPPLGRRVHPKSIGSQLCSSSGKGVSRIRSVISPTQQRAFGEDDLFKNRLWNSNTHRGAFPSRSPAAGEENSSIPFGTSQVDFGSYPKISRSTFPPQTKQTCSPHSH